MSYCKMNELSFDVLAHDSSAFRAEIGHSKEEEEDEESN